MNTEKAIEREAINLLKHYEKCKSDFDILVKRWDKLYEENKTNKKYRRIVEELENDYGFLGHRYDGSDSTDYLRYVIPRLKQKHFPVKEKNGKNSNTVKKNTT